MVHGFVNFGVFSIGQSLFVKDVQDEFSWGVAAISAGFSLRTLESGLMAPFGGVIIDKLGPKKVAIIGTVIQTIGLVIFATMEHLWQFYLSSFIVAFGQGLGAGQAFMNPVVFWFNRKRGQASAWIASGRGWAYMAAFPLSVILTMSGWRTAALASAVVYCAISIPCALVIRDRPEKYGYLPDGEPLPPIADGAKRAPPPEAEGFGAKQAMMTRAFWMILIVNMVFSCVTQTHQTHIITHLRYTGFAVQTASLIASFYGAFQVVGRLGAGWVGDRVGRMRMLAASTVFMAVGFCVIAFITPSNMWLTVPLYFATYGVGHASHIVVQQTVVADYFGPRRFATIRGFMSPISVFGSLLGPFLAGVAFDHFGTFKQAWFALAPVALLAGVALMLAGKPKFAAESPLRRARV